MATPPEGWVAPAIKNGASAPRVPRTSWPLDDTGHDAQGFQQLLRESILPLLRSVLRTLHVQEHSCSLCAPKVVTFDAKYGLTCRLCNPR